MKIDSRCSVAPDCVHPIFSSASAVSAAYPTQPVKTAASIPVATGPGHQLLDQARVVGMTLKVSALGLSVFLSLLRSPRVGERAQEALRVSF